MPATMAAGTVGTVMSIDLEQFNHRLPALQGELAAFINRRVHNADDRSDILQDTIASAVRHLDSLRDSAKLLPWMKTIALNRVRSLSAGRKDRKWESLADEVEQDKAGGHATDMLAEFEGVLSRLAALQEDPAVLTTASLHFCFDWSVVEIAALTGIKPKSVYARIQRCKERLRHRYDKTAPDAATAALKSNLAICLWNMGTFPQRGIGYRNSTLIQLAHSIYRITATQYPDNLGIVSSNAVMSYVRAWYSQFADDLDPDTQRIGDWRRDAWDKQLIATGHDYHQRTQRIKGHVYYHMLTSYFYELFAPATNDTVDYDKALRLLHGYSSYAWHPVNDMHESLILEYTRGPAAALKFLLERSNNATLSNMPLYYLHVSNYAMYAGQWQTARAAARKCLKWPLSDTYRDLLKTRIDDCAKRLRKGARRGK